MDMQKALLTLGLLVVLLGLFWPWISKVPIGRLPGDISISRDNMRFYFPITSMILVSIILSLVFGFFRR